MINIGKKSRMMVHWNVSPYDFSKEKRNLLISKISKKYSIPKDRIGVVPQFMMTDSEGNSLSINTDIIQNIQDPQFQQKLFKDWLSLNGVTDCDFDLITKIDADINGRIDYQVYDKYRRYCIKWIRWDNFLSYGADNYFDFTTLHGLVLLSGEPANQSGKTTFAIDLLHFLLFGKTSKVGTLDKIFNKHLSKASTAFVEGCINIDGVDYVIKRTLSRPTVERRTSKSKTTQKVEYYKVANGSMEELSEYTENMQEENTSKTNKAIKEAIGRESDFDLIMSVTEASLDDLVNKKEAERGRLLARWIGLLPIEEKESIAKDKFNSEIKPSLLSNLYDEEILNQEIEAFNLTSNSLVEANEKYKKEVEKLSSEIENLESNRNALLQSKNGIDENILKIDITTLKATIEKNINDGKTKRAELDSIIQEINDIGDVDFSVEDYDKCHEALIERQNAKTILGERYKSMRHDLQHLVSSEICPTCGRKLDNIDNSKRIKEIEEELKGLEKQGKEAAIAVNETTAKLESYKVNRERYTRKTQLVMKRSALELNVERLRNEYKDNISLKKEYEKNRETIDKNNKIEMSIRNTDVYIKGKKNAKETASAEIIKNEATIKGYQEQVSKRVEILQKIKQERHLVRNWKIYLDLVGKDGISKMVLRKALPIINARLSELLSDVCDFDVEVGITPKNDVVFYLVKDGVYSDLGSGSGFELTTAALALRAVLADISTISRCSFITLDEVLGRVAEENYGNIKKLIDKIAKSYDFILNITHLAEFKDFCDTHIVVTKENNVSKITLRRNVARSN